MQTFGLVNEGFRIAILTPAMTLKYTVATTLIVIHSDFVWLLYLFVYLVIDSHKRNTFYITTASYELPEFNATLRKKALIYHVTD